MVAHLLALSSSQGRHLDAVGCSETTSWARRGALGARDFELELAHRSHGVFGTERERRGLPLPPNLFRRSSRRLEASVIELERWILALSATILKEPRKKGRRSVVIIMVVPTG